MLIMVQWKTRRRRRGIATRPTLQSMSAPNVVLRTREGNDKRDGCRHPQTFQSTSSSPPTTSPTASSASALPPRLKLAQTSVPGTALLLPLSPSNEVFHILDVHNKRNGSSQPLSKKGEAYSSEQSQLDSVSLRPCPQYLSTYRVSFPGLRPPPLNLEKEAQKQDVMESRLTRQEQPRTPSSLPCTFAYLSEHNLLAVGLKTGEVLIPIFLSQNIPGACISGPAAR